MMAEGKGISVGKTSGRERKVVRKDIRTQLVVGKDQRQSREWEIKYSMCVWACIWLVLKLYLAMGFPLI